MNTIKWLLFFYLFSASFSLQAATAPVTLDSIVAVINNEVITGSELQAELKTSLLQLQASHIAVSDQSALKKQVLSQLIDKKLQLQVAKQANLSIDDQEVNQVIERIATQNNVTLSQLYGHLRQEGLTPAMYKDKLREQLLLQKVQQREVATKITITPEEVNHLLRSKMWVSAPVAEFHLEEVVIPFSEAPTSMEIVAAQAKTGQVISKLKQGAPLQSVLQADSMDALILQSHDFGWKTLQTLPTAFANFVSRMKEREVVGPIQSPNGFHVLRLVGIRKAQSKPIVPTRKQAENRLLQEKFEQAGQNWVSKLRGMAYIEIKKETA
jgi:peptidyl-prolyl cis-trans isomerase SurA